MNFEKHVGNLDDIKRIILPVTVGALLLSLASNLFIIPAGLLSGGLAGIALMTSYRTGISYGLIYLLLNIPMTLIALKFIGKKFTIQSFYVVLVVSFSQIFTSKLIGILGIKDIMLNAIFGGVVGGIGAGLIYRNGASGMGMDVVAMLLKKHFNFNVGDVNMAFNVIILTIASLLYGVEIALYTILSLYLGAKLGDNMMLGLGEKKNVMIMTKKYDEISLKIMEELTRGVTLLDGEGAYTKSPIKVVLTVVNTNQIAKLKNIVNTIDREAFMTISESMEVRGKGFRNYDNA